MAEETPTYDQKQMAAVLTTCQLCGKSWYMTHPRLLCLACQRAASERERVSGS